MKNTHTDSLTQVLATFVDFYFAYKFFHWNITGANFIEFHKLFDEHATVIYPSQDIVAERIRQLDEIAIGNLTHFATNSILDQSKPETCDNIREILEFLKTQHDKTIKLLSTIIDQTSEAKDFATADLLTAFLEDHQKMNYFIGSHLPKKSSK